MYRKIEVLTATQRVTIEIPTDVNLLCHMYEAEQRQRRRYQRLFNGSGRRVSEWHDPASFRQLSDDLRLQTAICQTIGKFVANAKLPNEWAAGLALATEMAK